MKVAKTKKLVLTRTQEQGSAMRSVLTAEGISVRSFPTIELVAPPDESIIRRALKNLDSFAWIIFTSVNAVHHFFSYAPEGEEAASTSEEVASLKRLALPKIAVVGPTTADALAAYGYHAELMPRKDFQAEGLLEAFADLEQGDRHTHDLSQSNNELQKVLIPRALIARDVLLTGLPSLGYEPIVAPVYETVQARPQSSALVELEGADAIVFTSPSTVKNFIAIFNDALPGIEAGQENEDHLKDNNALAYLAQLKIFSIGPVTTAELRAQFSATRDDKAYQVFEAEESTGESLTELILAQI